MSMDSAHSKPRFDNVSCSQCGADFGPGNKGFSHCSDHAHSNLSGSAPSGDAGNADSVLSVGRTSCSDLPPALLPCPFCGRDFGKDLSDSLYPTGTYWAERPDCGRHYFSHRDRVNYPDAHQCWNVVCNETEGGCGAEAHADSRDEVIAAWNRRAVCEASAGSAGSDEKAPNSALEVLTELVTADQEVAGYRIHHGLDEFARINSRLKAAWDRARVLASTPKEQA